MLGRSDAWAALLAFALIWAGLWGVLALGRRLPSREGRDGLCVAALLLLLLDVVTLHGNALTERRYTHDLLALWNAVGSVGHIGVGVALLLALALAARIRRPIARSAWVVLAVFGVFGATTAAQLAFAGLTGTEVAADAAHDRPAAAAQEARPRVVWLLFDELDQRAVFDDGLGGLPHLAALAARGVRVDHALPAGQHTLDSVPDLWTGIDFTSAEAVGPAKLRLRRRDLGATDGGVKDGGVPDGGVTDVGVPDGGVTDGGVTDWGATPTFASDVNAAGGHVALAGWYHPYCDLFAADATRCRFVTAGVVHSRAGLPFAARVIDDLASVAPWSWRQRAIAANVALSGFARAWAVDPSVDVAYIHLPLPHEPFTWDAEAGAPVLWRSFFGGYEANLQWVDAIVGDVDAALAASPLAGRTTIVISADHGWRSAPALAGRPVDTRVAWVVVPPRGPAQRVEAEIPARTIGPMVTALAAGNLPAETGAIAGWLRAHASAAVPPTAPTPPR